MDLDEIIARYQREYLASRSFTVHEQQLRGWILRRVARSMEGRSLLDITVHDALAFYGAGLEKGLHPNTVDHFGKAVRSFVEWGELVCLIEPERAAPVLAIPRPRGAGYRLNPRPYSPTEIRQFRAELAKRYPALPPYGKGSHALLSFQRGRHTKLRRHLYKHAIRLQLEAQVALALEMGLRRVEILNLTIPAMHYDNDELVILTAKQAPGLKVTRTVPMTKHARRCIQEWLDFRSLLNPPHESPWLRLAVTVPFEEQISPMPLKQMKDVLLRFPPRRQWQWHRFRHTAATEWLRAGVPVEKVQLLLGHADIETTLAYTKIGKDDVRKAVLAAEANFAKRMGIAA